MPTNVSVSDNESSPGRIDEHCNEAILKHKGPSGHLV